MNNWYCSNCKTWNDMHKTRCGFCSQGKPENKENVNDISKGVDDLSQKLHNVIDRLTIFQKKKLYHWLEDNII